MLAGLQKKRVALVHDYLVQDGGAERVLAEIHRMFPDAPLFVLLHDPGATHPDLRRARIIPSFLQRVPFTRPHYQWTLPLMPMATEHMDLSGFDLVISSSSSFAKGVITPPDAVHVCYCHTPTRFLWEDRARYPFLLPLLHRIRQWDRLAACRPDAMATNSETSRARIARYYGRGATVIPPPVQTDAFRVGDGRGGYWLAGGRLVPYKRFDLIVKAFAKLNIPLKIFGTGPEERRLRRMAGPRTELVGHVSDDIRAPLYRDAVGFVSPQLEDFGITMVEAMASGRPVITFGKGGGGEIVEHGVTGIHITEQSWEAIGDAVIRFDPGRFDPHLIRKRAERYAAHRFREAFISLLTHAMDH